MTNIDADLTSPFGVTTRNNVLTVEGIEQAKFLGEELMDKEIQEIICSPFSRTQQTAYTIASVLANCVPIHYDPRLQEIEWDVGGDFDRLENYIPGFDSKKLPVDHRPIIDHKRGAITLESQQDVYERVIPALLDIVETYRGKNVLIVTHFFVVRAFEAFVRHADVTKMLDFSPKNTKIIEYSVEEIEWAIHQSTR